MKVPIRELMEVLEEAGITAQHPRWWEEKSDLTKELLHIGYTADNPKIHILLDVETNEIWAAKKLENTNDALRETT